MAVSFNVVIIVVQMFLAHIVGIVIIIHTCTT